MLGANVFANHCKGMTRFLKKKNDTTHLFYAFLGFSANYGNSIDEQTDFANVWEV